MRCKHTQCGSHRETGSQPSTRVASKPRRTWLSDLHLLSLPLRSLSPATLPSWCCSGTRDELAPLGLCTCSSLTPATPSQVTTRALPDLFQILPRCHLFREVFLVIPLKQTVWPPASFSSPDLQLCSYSPCCLFCSIALHMYFITCFVFHAHCHTHSVHCGIIDA